MRHKLAEIEAQKSEGCGSLGQAERKAGILVVNQFFTAGSAFLVGTLAAFVLSPTDRGWLALWLQIGYVATTICLLGIERQYIVAHSGNLLYSVSNLARLVRFGVALAGLPILVGAIVAASGDGALGTSLAILGSFIICNIAFRIVRVGYIVSHQKAIYLSLSLTAQLVLIVGALVFIYFGVDTLLGWQTLYVLSVTLSGVTVAAMVVKMRGISSAEKQTDRADIIAGFRLLPGSLGNTAMVRSDRFFLPVLAGPAALGVYVVVATAMELASWPVQQWVDAKLRHWKEEPIKVGNLLRVALFAAFLVATFAALAGIFTWILITSFLPAAYREGLNLALPLGVAAVIYASTRVVQGGLVALGRNLSVSASEVIGFLGSALAFLFLIPTMGTLGAALGVIFGYAVCLVSSVFFLLSSRLNWRD